MKSSPVLEADIEDAFVDYAASKGFDALKLRIDGRNGWFDRTVFTPVGVIVFEFKRPKGKARKMQDFWAKLLTGMGYRVVRPTRIGEAEAELDRFINEN